MAETIKSEAHKIENLARPLTLFSDADLTHNGPQYELAAKIFNEFYQETNSFLKANPGSMAALAKQISEDRTVDRYLPEISIDDAMIGVKPIVDSGAYFGRSKH